jgi:hypothetical protein
MNSNLQPFKFLGISEKEIQDFERNLGFNLPPKLRVFLNEYYGFEIQGSRIFDFEKDYEIVRNGSKINLSIHDILTFEDILRIIEAEKEEEGYGFYFGTYWDKYIPFMAAFGNNGYFLAGVREDNLDEIIYVDYNQDMILKICQNVFVLFENYFKKGGP